MSEERNKSITTLNLELSEGMQAEVKQIKIEQTPRYYKVGNGIRNTFMGKTHTPLDAIEIITDMTIRELYALKLLKSNLILKEERTHDRIKLRTSCESIIINSNLTNPEQQKFKAGFKLLHKKNIVKRIKREHYILNPNFIIPYFYEEELKLFETLS